MPNIATLLKDEITRLARKEIRVQTDAMKKQLSQQRHDIVALKRNAASLEKKLSKLETQAPQSQSTVTPAPADGQDDMHVRFTAKGLRSQRKRVGLTAASYAKLLGVTPQSIYNWERGTTRPRKAQVALLATLRGIGKKEINAKLEALAD